MLSTTAESVEHITDDNGRRTMNKVYKHFLKNYVFTQKKYFVFVCFITVLQSVVSMCIPLTSRELLDNAFPNRNMQLFTTMVIVMLTIFISAFEIVSSSTYSNVEEDYLKQNGNASQIQAFDVPLESFENFKMDNIEEIGQSVYIGNAVNDEFRNRPSELRYADSNYAECMFSLPIQGRMPENKNEIAVDRSVLEDLEKDATLGTDITIYWLDEDKKEQSQTFEVVGIWEENSLYTTRNLWVSKDFIKKMNTNIDLAFNLKNGKVNNKTLGEVAEKLQIEEEQVISNWVYEDNVQKQIRLETLVYKIGASFILLCGFLILYNIIAISIASDRKLYGRIKTLGASPKQVKLSVFYQYFFDVLIGIPLGLALGYILGSKMVPVVITSLDNDIYVYADVKNFISTILLILLVVFVSGIRPAYRACAVDPSDILSEENNLNFQGKTHRRSPGVPALFELSLSNLVRYPKRNVIAITLLTVGLVLTSCVYVINHSFDISKYMAEIALSDITITEKTLVESWGEYNPKGNTITKEFMEKLEVLHRIVLGTTEGSLCLDNSNGLVIWNPQMYVPHAEGVLDMYGNNSYVELPVSEVADGVRNTTYAEVYKELWPEGIVCALNDFARAITDNSQKNIMAQQMLTISEIWKDLSEKIGSPQLIVTPERNGIRLADIAE